MWVTESQPIHLSFQLTRPALTTATLTCNSGYTLSGTSQSTCTGGVFTPTLGTCNLGGSSSGTSCTNPTVLNGQITYSQGNTFDVSHQTSSLHLTAFYSSLDLHSQLQLLPATVATRSAEILSQPVPMVSSLRLSELVAAQPDRLLPASIRQLSTVLSVTVRETLLMWVKITVFMIFDFSDDSSGSYHSHPHL